MTDYLILRTERTGYPYPVRNEPVVGYCAICGRPVFEYEDYYTDGFLDPDIICDDCKTLYDYYKEDDR